MKITNRSIEFLTIILKLRNFVRIVFPPLAFVFALMVPVTVYCFRQPYLGHRFLSYWILPVAFLSLLTFAKHQWELLANDALQFAKPFLPWIATCCLLPFFQPMAYHPEHQLFPFACAICLFLCLYAYRISKATVILVCALSNIFINLFICWFASKGDTATISVFLNINVNCLLGSLLLLLPLSFVGIFVYWKKDLYLGGICLASSIFGFLGVALLQARTGLIAMLSLVLIVFFIPKKHRAKLAISLTLVLVILIGYFVHTGRLGQGFSDLQNWWNGNTVTSWGIRLFLWKSSLLGLQVHPFVGWGENPFMQIIGSGLLTLPSSWPGSFHFHSDIFHALASFGLIGGITWAVMQYQLIHRCLSDPFRLLMLVSLLLGGLSDVYWPFCKYSCYTFYILWVLLTLADRPTNT